MDDRDFPKATPCVAVWCARPGQGSPIGCTTLYSFQRYEVEAAQFVPVVRDRLVLAVHGWGVFTDVASGQEAPFFMLPTLGGGNTLRGDRNYRYHDCDFSPS